MSWHTYYNQRINNIAYETQFKTKYKPFIDIVVQSIKQGFTVAETGAGTGLASKLIKQSCSQASFTLYDNSPDMLRLADHVISCPKYIHDITHINNTRYDLIHSHGVLEHFNIPTIKHIINMQLKQSNKLIHYVPSNKYDYKGFGDELLLSLNQWHDIVAFSGGDVIPFNGGYDLVLKW